MIKSQAFMSKKILVVYNTCGISERENTDFYIENIQYILDQNFSEFDVCLSSCLNRDEHRKKIRDRFGNSIKYNFINEKHPVNVTFNYSIDRCIESNGIYEGYFYLDSGTRLVQKNLLLELYKKLITKKYGMISPQPSNDTEYFNGLGIGRYDKDDDYARQILFKNGDYLVPVGKAFATHTNLISEELRSFYGKVYPDIFSSHCTESTFSFINAALGKQWILLKDFIMPHEISMDGQSSGFSPLNWRIAGGRLYDHPYKINSILSRLCTSEAYSCGFGYEECNNIFMHDPLQFDENYLCKNDNLKFFIKDNLFLKPSELDYTTINHEFIN